jgi:holo-[acyl-carrier protein] synthase
MIKGIGIDLIEIDRIKEAMGNEHFLDRIFTLIEIEFFRTKNMRPETVAGSFAAKEAVAKALGSGIGEAGWKDIVIRHDENGAPTAMLEGGAKERFDKLDGERVLVSITHSQTAACAVAVIEGR